MPGVRKLCCMSLFDPMLPHASGGKQPLEDRHALPIIFIPAPLTRLIGPFGKATKEDGSSRSL
jgi:hypothetical protein